MHRQDAWLRARVLALCCSPVQTVQGRVDAQRLQRPWCLSHRRQQLAEAEALRQYNAEAKEQGRPLRHFWSSLYLPEQGMFCQAPADLQLGTPQKASRALVPPLPQHSLPKQDMQGMDWPGSAKDNTMGLLELLFAARHSLPLACAAVAAHASSNRMPWLCNALLHCWWYNETASSSLVLQEEDLDAEEEEVSMSVDGHTLTKHGLDFAVGDYVYVRPDTFDQLEQAAQAEVPDYAAKGRFHKVRLLLPCQSM